MIKVLYVEDEEMLQKLIAELIETHLPQIELIPVTSPVIAIAMIEGGITFDLVITDCDMPELSGFDVIKACINQDLKQVIMVSGNPPNLYEAEQRFSSSINLQTIAKPVKVMKLTEMILQATSTSQQEQVT